MENYRVGRNPHIRHEDSSRSLLLDFCIALTPSLIWGIYAFGMRAFLIVSLSVVFCLFWEALSLRILKRKAPVASLSAVATGLLLAMALPASVSLWVPVVGAFFAIVVAKQLLGLWGKNFFNPPLFARAILLLLIPSQMNGFPQPFSPLSPFSFSLSQETLSDEFATASPLTALQEGSRSMPVISDLLTGSFAGCIGGVSALLLFTGFLYLLVRRVITWHIPVSFLVTAAALSFFFPGGGDRLEWMITFLLSGGVLLGAVFLATDGVTSPVTDMGKVIFGVLCGVLTVVFRAFVSDAYGAGLAILLANLTARPLDFLCRPRPYGTSFFAMRKKTKGFEA